MQPHAQYTQTTDKLNIAFWTLGEGTPLVDIPSMPWSHIELEWRIPELRGLLQRLAARYRVVRFDPRGSGLSDRDLSNYTLDGLVLDLEAVVDRLGLDRFVLLGVVNSGPVAVAYAARHPERVSHLLLWCTYARGSVIRNAPRAQALWSLANQDWELFSETLAHAFLGWSAGEAAHRYAAFMRESAAPEAFQALIAFMEEVDVSELLPTLQTPTLVMQRRQVPLPDPSLARQLASSIPDARLVMLEGSSVAPYLEDMDSVLRAIDEFVGEADVYPIPATPTLVTILFTDMEASTLLTQTLGDARAQELVRAHNAIVRQALVSHGGSEIKRTGDGIMAAFPSASRAVDCAIAIQKAFQEYDQRHPDLPIKVRVGLNAGEPVAEDQDLFGTVVQLAARICTQAQPGQILTSDVVRQLVAGKGFLFSDMGDVALRGFRDPIRLHEVRWQITTGPR